MENNNSNNSRRSQFFLCLATLFYVFFAWQQWWAGVIPRLIRGSEVREGLHHQHLAMGTSLFVILLLLSLFWLLKPGALKRKLSEAFATASRTAISLFFLFSWLLVIYGLAQAWAKEETTAVFGVIPLPRFLDISWSTAGYMHSSTASITIYLFSGIVFVYLYRHLLRYVQPGIAVALLILLHLLVNLPKPPSLHPIAAVGTYILTPFVYLLALSIYVFFNQRKIVYWPIYTLLILLLLHLPYLAFKAPPPWFPSSEPEVTAQQTTQNLEPSRDAADIFVDEASYDQAMETTAWCRQCHNFQASNEHLLGPNLSGVFNRQIATAEGYGRYSDALKRKGNEGQFWTRENLAQFLTQGQKFAPGNLMNQQTDLSDPQQLQRAIDMLEYISTKRQVQQ